MSGPPDSGGTDMGGPDIDANVDAGDGGAAACPTTIEDLQAQILVPSCATPGCHTTASRAVGLDLQSPGLAARLVGVGAVSCSGSILVVPGDPMGSFLIDKVTNDLPACGSRMPLGGVLDPASVECLRAWITSLTPTDGGSMMVDAGTPPNDVGVDASGCPSTLSDCSGMCLDLNADPSHCGACSTDCGSGGTCGGGTCGCMAGLMMCGGACADTQGDVTNCGACGMRCRPGQVCAHGACAIGRCPAGTTQCGASCYDTQTDPLHCGSCTNACAAGLGCNAGRCGCAATETNCGGACVDTSTSPLNCGGCGIACGQGEACIGGSCQCTGTGMVCGGVCVDTASDTSNCGSCGHACAAGQGCSGGTCGCSAGQMSCGGTCIDVQNDPANCGSCGHVCAAGQGCMMGTCQGCGPTVTLSGQVQPILTASCASAGCHSGGVRTAAGLSLAAGQTYGATVNVVAGGCSDGRFRVEPGRPDRSYLVNKITGVGICSGSQMPVTGASLTAAQIALIEGWICEGAPNN